jgi:hypothetical protein
LTASGLRAKYPLLLDGKLPCKLNNSGGLMAKYSHSKGVRAGRRVCALLFVGPVALAVLEWEALFKL